MAPTTKSTTTSRSGKVAWNRELKLGLHLLYTEFNLNPNQRLNAFNTVFAQHLTACGVSEGITNKTLGAQWHERHKPNTRDWPSICQPLIDPADVESRDALRVRIRAALSTSAPQSASHMSTHMRKVRSASPEPLRTPVAELPAEASSSRSTRSRRTISQAKYNPPQTPTRARRSSPVVVISTPASVSKLRQARTPRAAGPSTPRVAIQRNDGTTILVSPKAAKAIERRVQPVPEWKAQPPLSGLLFRYWQEDGVCDRDSRNGFWARKYYKSNVVPHIPPKSTSIDPVDIFNHMDRKMEKTPFISTSSRLIWIIQLLIKGLKSGKDTGRLTLIDTSALDKRTVFHARPFHQEIAKTHSFSNGAWHYPGTYEFMVWRNIPRRAILHTFEAQEFLDFAAENAAIRSALQLDVLHLPGKSLSRTKIPMMQKNSASLTPNIVLGLSQLCIFFGLDARSSMEHVSHIISDVVEGWGIEVERRSEEQWYQLATTFARDLCKRTNPRVTSIKETESVKFAFLKGVEWGCGKVNATHSTALIAKKNRKAAAAGLEDPARIITDQLDAARLTVLAFQKTEQRRLEAYHGQNRALPAPANADADDDDEMLDDDPVDMDMEDVEPTTPIQQPAFEDDEIRYDDPDDDDFMLEL